MTLANVLLASTFLVCSNFARAHEKVAPETTDGMVAAKPFSCFTSILEYLSTTKLTPAQLDCVAKDAEVKSSMAVLCSKDKNAKESFSKAFTLYQELKEQIGKLETKIKEARETKDRISEIRLLNERSAVAERLAATVELKIDTALDPISSAIYHCSRL